MADKIFFKTGLASSLPTTKTAGQLLFAIDGTTGSIYLDKDSKTRIKFNADAIKLATPRSINGTSFDGSSDITTTNWGTARNISISDATGVNTGTAVSVNGSKAVTLLLPATIKATLDGNAATATKATSADSANTAASCTGNAATASKLKTGVAINGTTFDGSTAITTANWGTARTITISDNDGTNTQANSGINGSANFTLKLPATIKASLSGNASTADKFSSNKTITLKGAITGTYSSDGSSDWSIPTEIAGATIDDSFNTQYRTQIKGNANYGNFLKVIRNNTDGVANSPKFGSGLGWGRADTHGYLYVSYSSAEAYLGGGNQDLLNWRKKIAFADGTGASGTWGINVTGYSKSISYPDQLTTDDAINAFNTGSTFQVSTWNNTSSPGVSNGILINAGWTSSAYGAQIAIDDDPTYYIALRQKDNNSWSAWKRIPMGDGTGASGTWGINITGSAGSVAWGNITGKPSFDYLPLSGGTMNGTAVISWPDTGNWNNSNSGVTFPVVRGGFQWYGQSDYIKLFAEETASDELNLVCQLGDDSNPALVFRNNSGTQVARIGVDGTISATIFSGNKLYASSTDSDAIHTVGGILASHLRIDNGNSSGYIELKEDGEGGTITLGGPNGSKWWEMDCYNSSDLRIFSHDGSNYQFFVFGGNGTLSAPRFSGDWNGNAIGIGYGGTGVTSLNDLRKLSREWAPIDSSNDTTSNWGVKGLSVAGYGDTNSLTDKPSYWGIVLNVNSTDTEVHQLWFTQPTGRIFHRGGNGSGWNGSWRLVYSDGDSIIYSSSEPTDRVKGTIWLKPA